MTFRAMALTIIAVMSCLHSCNRQDTGIVLRDAPCLPQSRPQIWHSIVKAQSAFLDENARREELMRQAIDPSRFNRTIAKALDQAFASPNGPCASELVSIGERLFTHDFQFAEGLGSGTASTDSQPFKRVHHGLFGGPETQSCASCHWQGGIAGSGSLLDNSFVHGNGKTPRSADARNPPALFGSGLVQAIAEEMSAELQEQRRWALARAAESKEVFTQRLVSKGVDFGVLRVAADGSLNTSGTEGIDDDLVVRPFGWKGEFASLQEFVGVSLQVHLGIQSDELLAAHKKGTALAELGSGPSDDPDGDGIKSELDWRANTALVFYLSSLKIPEIFVPKGADASEPSLPQTTEFYDRWNHGKTLFADIGCALCHRPTMTLNRLSLNHQSAAKDASLKMTLDHLYPRGAEKGRNASHSKGTEIWVFSDFKRHDMGQQPLEENGSLHLTRRLWGLADSAPYFYDGSAPTLDAAVRKHGGEAQYARSEFESLTSKEKGSLRIFLLSLRRPKQLVVP